MLHLTNGVSLSGHANKWGNWQVVRKEMFVKLLFCHHCVRSDTRREWKQDAFAPERRGTSSRTRLTLSGRAEDGKHSECGVASFLSWILYTQYVLLLPTPKTDLFSPCLQSMRWTTLTWWIPLEPHSNTLFSKNMIQLPVVNSKLRWPKSQRHGLLGFFLLSLTVCVIRPRKFMARQSYFSEKSSSFTSAILNTAFRQVSSLRELVRQPVTFSAYFAIANFVGREGDALTETAKYLWVCSCNTCILASPKFSTLLPLTCHRMSAMVWEPFPKQAEHLRFAGFPRWEGKRFTNRSQFCREDLI